MRIGQGYDVHRLEPGLRLVLGGVEIPFELGLLGHSDADVLIHAVMDALLGAAALGDIGGHFPDTDPSYRGISSLVLLGETARLLSESGFSVVNVDSTVVAQAPKLSAHIGAMRQNLADALGISPEQVNVKATTEERLGFTGEGRGIAAQAAVLLEKTDLR
nr:2-C-methyl-D-erythritol 2,4-cyclodiphosphate synthase [Papillibacter cinnamivorans]